MTYNGFLKRYSIHSEGLSKAPFIKKETQIVESKQFWQI